MQLRFIPLFWKFTIGIVIAVFLFTAVTVPFLWSTITNSLERELSNRINLISKGIEQRAAKNILYDEISELNELVNRIAGIDSTIAYIMVINERNKVLAHTFTDGLPVELVNANSLKNSNQNIVKIEPSDQGEIILDIAYPLMHGHVGMVRVGLYENQIQSDISFLFNSLLIIFLLFLVNGILIAFIYSSLIVTPIKFISKISADINLDTLDIYMKQKKILESGFSFRLRRLFFSKDEIDTLYEKFSEMIIRLDLTLKELKKTNKSILNSEKLASIGILASGIAHEINNPLIGIKNCLRRLTSNKDTVQSQKYLEMMNEATEKINSVIQGLLNFSRKQDFELSDINIVSPLANSLQLASYHLEKNNIEVSIAIPNNTPPIKGSKNHIEQVMLNLIINSVDAIVEKKKLINGFPGKITFNSASGGNELIFLISDNGVGIKEEDIHKVFDPFFTTKEIGQGTGLGLTISQNIINKHNAKFVVESDYGKGTTVKLIFPLNN